MNFIQYITLILLSLEPFYGDKEPWDVRTERMTLIAEAIDDASSKATCEDAYAVDSCKKIWNGSKKDLALLLVTKGFWESRFAKHVHEGKCHPKECDAVLVRGKVYHKARSIWQIQKVPSLVSNQEYKMMNSSTLEGTKVSANVATRFLSLGLNTCHNIKGAIAMYGGAGCNWTGANNRFVFFNNISSKSEQQFKESSEQRRVLLEARLARGNKEKVTKKSK